eukprot:XP_011421704.1 PREDICTED: uncharacterized protein LOC105324338 [Crassostrea gigas]
MQCFAFLALVVVALVLVGQTDAWWLVGRNGNNNQCPSRETATPYYFGTTDLSCMHRNIRGKRSAPSRGTLEWVHRFIYYKGYYFEFFGKYNTVAEKDGKAYLLVISKARVAVMQAETILILGHFIQVNKKMTNYRKILVSKRLISRMLGRSTKSSVYQNK